MDTKTSQATRAEVCIAACADTWLNAGPVLASAMGTMPRLGAGLAKITASPDLVITDGQSMLLSSPRPLGPGDSELEIEGWLPFRHIFDLIWSGRRQVMMGAAQIDRWGNTNISCIGDWEKPHRQLLGSRGVPGNTINHPCTFWVPSHSSRVFVESVDFVSGAGYDPALWPNGVSAAYHDLREVVTNLAVCDFGGEANRMRLKSVHPGVTVEEVLEQTGFELEVPEEVPITREPNERELALIRDRLDPDGAREAEVR